MSINVISIPKSNEKCLHGNKESLQDDMIVLDSFEDLMEECDKLRFEKRAFHNKYKLMKREYEDKLNKCHDKEVQLKDVVNVLKHEIKENNKLLKEKESQKQQNMKTLELKLDEALSSEKNLREIVSILEHRISQDKMMHMKSNSKSSEQEFLTKHIQTTAVGEVWGIHKSEKSPSEYTSESHISREPVPQEETAVDTFLNLYLHFY